MNRYELYLFRGSAFTQNIRQILYRGGCVEAELNKSMRLFDKVCSEAEKHVIVFKLM
jgi:hypothetical protein